MEFTEEQRKHIDILLSEGEEYDKKMENKTYNHEEFWDSINKYIEKLENERIRD